MGINAYSDKEHAEFWENIGKGAMITLSNTETMTESQNRGLGFKPMEFEVSQVIHLCEINNLAGWIAIKLNDSTDNLWLWVKMVNGILDIKSCWENDPEDYTPGDRQDMVDNDCGWLFTEKSIETYLKSNKLNDLVYSEAIQGRRWIDEKAGKFTDFVFDKKGNAEFQCECVEPDIPNDDLMGTVAEYNCSDENCPDPEMIVFEIGTYEDDEDDTPDRGGLIRILHGSNISLNNIDVLNATN
jgi:hypothetical protein